MDNKSCIVNIQFTDEDMNMILKYQELIEAVTVQDAVMNAISIALDEEDQK